MFKGLHSDISLGVAVEDPCFGLFDDSAVVDWSVMAFELQAICFLIRVIPAR
jgi:hypothetical protein